MAKCLPAPLGTALYRLQIVYIRHKNNDALAPTIEQTLHLEKWPKMASFRTSKFGTCRYTHAFSYVTINLYWCVFNLAI